MSAVVFYAVKDVRKNRRAFIFITIAIALSTANIIILNGMVDGMTDDMVERILETSAAHISIYPNEKDKYIEGLGIKEQKLESMEEVIAYSPRLSSGGSLSYREKSKTIKLLALEPQKENSITTLLGKIDSGETLEANDRSGILISYRIALDLKAKIGEDATLVFENGDSKVYRIKGIMRSGTAMDLNTVVINFDEAAEHLGLNNKASIVLVRLSDISFSGEYKTKITRELGVQKVKEWKQEVESILSTAETFGKISSVINAVGLFASAVSVGVIMYINILHKRRQIGVMKAIGMRDSQILSVYIFEAALIGIIGIIIGNALGYAGTKYLEAHPFTDPITGDMAPRFYPYLLYDASLVAMLTVLIASLYPALIAGRMNIIKAIWGT
ncbi:MAG: FtsX-like permease family protein [Candidatus Methanoperedens sp.]|nr:FtsX-like permease family protein [Candidatus Methanoperedens sp.]